MLMYGQSGQLMGGFMSRWACVAVAVALAVTKPAPVLATTDQFQQLQAECEAGDGFACKRLGTRLNMGFPDPAQPVKARAAFEKGCKFKDSAACAFLYQMLALGQGGPPDAQRAKALEQAACNHPQMGITSALKGSGLCVK